MERNAAAAILIVLLAACVVRADPVAAPATDSLADTCWAVVDVYGDRFEVHFDNAGTVTARRITNRRIKIEPSGREPFALGDVGLVVSTGGKWTQHDSSVEFILDADAKNKMAEALHPNYVYTGTIAGPRIKGTMQSKYRGTQKWTAVLTSELTKRTDGPPILLLGQRPRLPSPDSPAGSATIQLKISATGSVVEASVVEASSKEFGSSTKETVTQWIFLPAVKNSQPVPAIVKIPFTFAAAVWEK